MINRVPNRPLFLIAVLLIVVGSIGSGCSSSTADAKKSTSTAQSNQLAPSKKDFNQNE